MLVEEVNTLVLLTKIFSLSVKWRNCLLSVTPGRSGGGGEMGERWGTFRSYKETPALAWVCSLIYLIWSC